ncbi:TPA: ABC-2 family transporter protein [Streptococcus suis]|nr:ABC-2 family transporter protein [Streptococcus suis]
MTRYFYLYIHFMKLQWKRYIQYREDAVIGIIGYSVNTVISIYVLKVFLDNLSNFPGWSTNELVLLFGFVTMARAGWNFIFINTLFIGDYVREGTFDVLLLRPVNTLLLIIFSKIDLESIGEFCIGLIIFWMALLTEFETLSAWFILKIILLLIGSILCYAAIHLFVNSLTFFIKDVYSINFIVWRLDETTRYPNSIYPSWLSILLWFIPYAFIGYFPLMSITKSLPLLADLGTISAGYIIFLLVYKIVWKFSISRYHSYRQ